MRFAATVIAAVLLAGTSWSPGAHAQGVPQGTYLNSCSNTAIQGDSLVATCRRTDGREQTSRLGGVHNCIGDIGNNNGILQCGLKGGGQARGQLVAGPAPGPRPGFGPGPGPGPGAAQPSFGAPPPGWERARWERCHELHERTEELRARLDREYDRVERARMEGRLHELRREEDRCR